MKNLNSGGTKSGKGKKEKVVWEFLGIRTISYNPNIRINEVEWKLKQFGIFVSSEGELKYFAIEAIETRGVNGIIESL